MRYYSLPVIQYSQVYGGGAFTRVWLAPDFPAGFEGTPFVGAIGTVNGTTLYLVKIDLDLGMLDINASRRFGHIPVDKVCDQVGWFPYSCDDILLRWGLGGNA